MVGWEFMEDIPRTAEGDIRGGEGEVRGGLLGVCVVGFACGCCGVIEDGVTF